MSKRQPCFQRGHTRREGFAILQVAVRGLELDMPGYDVAQSVGARLSLYFEIGPHAADLAGSEEIQSVHLVEALHIGQS